MRKKLHLILATFSIVFLNLHTSAQDRVRCATDEYMEMMKQQDPGYEQRIRDLDRWIDDQIANGAAARNAGVVYTIPVVVHVVYNTAAQNISDELIRSQIDVLNEDFNAYNSDKWKTPSFFRSRIGNGEIRFALATRDPNGNATNGITRTSTAQTSFSQTGNPIKFTAQGGHDAWPAASYLNIWVGPLGGGLLGYAQFPGGAAATDGVVILWDSFGRVSAGSPYHYGRTTTHEVGHWLNLSHIWGSGGCGTDNVSDTPVQTGSNFGCPSCHDYTCNNYPTGDMYMNYMDYVDDRCMYMFTAGQVTRMRTAITGSRAGLITSLGLNVITSSSVDAGITDIISPGLSPCTYTAISFDPEVTLKNFGTTALTSATINYKVDNGSVSTYNWTGNLAAGSSTNVTLPLVTITSPAAAATDHIFYCYTSSPNGGADGNTLNDRTQRNFIHHAVNASLPYSQSFDAATFPSGWLNKNYDCTPNKGWARTIAATHSGAGAYWIDNINQSYIGVVDELITQTYNLTTAANPAISFWVAYAPQSAGLSDTLEVLISTDCGYTYTSIYKKWGATLQTASPQAGAFTPTAAQWRQETVSLSAYSGANNAVFTIRNISNTSNNLYIDDISIANSVGLEDINTVEQFNLYPNPSQGLFNINMTFTQAMDARLVIHNVLGERIYEQQFYNTASEFVSVDLRTFTSGLYIIELQTPEGSVIKKAIVH